MNDTTDFKFWFIQQAVQISLVFRCIRTCYSTDHFVVYNYLLARDQWSSKFVLISGRRFDLYPKVFLKRSFEEDLGITVKLERQIKNKLAAWCLWVLSLKFSPAWCLSNGAASLNTPETDETKRLAWRFGLHLIQSKQGMTAVGSGLSLCTINYITCQKLPYSLSIALWCLHYLQESPSNSKKRSCSLCPCTRRVLSWETDPQIVLVQITCQALHLRLNSTVYCKQKLSYDVMISHS